MAEWKMERDVVTVSPMGVALRELCGDAKVGDGPIEVMMRKQDFNVVNLQTASGPQSVPAMSLVAFTAMAFRELKGADVWEFRVTASEGGQALMYVAGADILTVRARSKVL